MSTKHNGNIHRTETPDVSHIRNVEVTHERSDVDVGGILKFIIGLTLMTIAVYLLMWGFFRLLTAQAKKEPAPGPMAMSEKERLPPEPRLQGAKGFAEELQKATKTIDDGRPLDPKWEIHVLRQMWDDSLKNGMRDSNGQVVGMPIEDAIKKVAESNLPSRATGATQGQNPYKEFAISIPTAASSGRMTEKRLQ